jgi:hypothetical protein
VAPARGAFYGTALQITAALGINQGLIALGLSAMRFG